MSTAYHQAVIQGRRRCRHPHLPIDTKGIIPKTNVAQMRRLAAAIKNKK